jgi:hypothetical protein
VCFSNDLNRAHKTVKLHGVRGTNVALMQSIEKRVVDGPTLHTAKPRRLLRLLIAQKPASRSALLLAALDTSDVVPELQSPLDQKRHALFTRRTYTVVCICGRPIHGYVHSLFYHAGRIVPAHIAMGANPAVGLEAVPHPGSCKGGSEGLRFFMRGQHGTMFEAWPEFAGSLLRLNGHQPPVALCTRFASVSSFSLRRRS